MSGKFKLQTFRIKTEGFPVYFKVTTDYYQSEVYLVIHEPDSDEINSTQIYFGDPFITKKDAYKWCMEWIKKLSEQKFEII